LIAVCDTCFLIDWARYSRRELVFKAFRRLLTPKQVLDEVVSERTLGFIVGEMAKGRAVLYEPLPPVLDEASRLIRFSIEAEFARRIDLPEAICLAVARNTGYTVLTENTAALTLPRILRDYSGVKVWRALELLKEAHRRGLIEDFKRELENYCKETKHTYPLEEAER